LSCPERGKGMEQYLRRDLSLNGAPEQTP
jgi:hypothetical protein